MGLAQDFNLRNSYRQVPPPQLSYTPPPTTAHHPPIPNLVYLILYVLLPAMDTLIAKYYTPQDDFYDDENSSMQYQSTKPSLDLKFSLPPISQVHIQFCSLAQGVNAERIGNTDVTYRDSPLRSFVLQRTTMPTRIAQ